MNTRQTKHRVFIFRTTPISFVKMNLKLSLTRKHRDNYFLNLGIYQIVPIVKNTFNQMSFYMNINIQKIFAKTFACIFFSLTGLVVITTFISAIKSFIAGEDLTQVIIQIINSNIIAIAVFELAMVIHKEYGHDNEHDVTVLLRRTLPRFIGTVCIALALEGLIMVIKYSQMDMAGNLYYPVAIVMSAGVLLISLGLFLKYAPKDP